MVGCRRDLPPSQPGTSSLAAGGHEKWGKPGKAGEEAEEHPAKAPSKRRAAAASTRAGGWDQTHSRDEMEMGGRGEEMGCMGVGGGVPGGMRGEGVIT